MATRKKAKGKTKAKRKKAPVAKECVLQTGISAMVCIPITKGSRNPSAKVLSGRHWRRDAAAATGEIVSETTANMSNAASDLTEGAKARTETVKQSASMG
jgi:hypothetical protein